MATAHVSAARVAEVTRDTKETQITARLNLDGTGNGRFNTGVPFLEHMLGQLCLHSMIDLDIEAAGDLHVDAHHTVEDIGICFGQTLRHALGTKTGIARYGHAYVPLDESLSRAVIDLSGRTGLSFNVNFTRAVIGNFDVELVREFFQGMVNHAMITLHLDNLAGDNAHHQAESLFKAFARALRLAISIDTRRMDETASTKGVL